MSRLAQHRLDQHFYYAPFGGELVSQHAGNGNYDSPYHFNAKEVDPETGLQYYGARYYDPKVSVWLSVDPLAQDYPSLSPYTFVANNPVHAIDPDGKRIFFVAGAGNDAGGVWKYPQRFKRIWEKAGIKDFKILNVSHGKWGDMMFTDIWRHNNFIAVPRGALIKATDDKMIMETVAQIKQDLAANPLAEGEQFNLAGYSYGSVMQAQVALALIKEGIKIDNLVLIGSPISVDSELYKKLLRAQADGMLGNISRQDIEGDKLSNPRSELEYLQGAIQNSSDDGAHFDLARPGAAADEKIRQAAEQAKQDGVK